MRLTELIEGFPSLKIYGDGSIDIRMLADHSKALAPGALFLPTKQVSREILREVERSGASAIWTPEYLPGLSIVQVVGSLDAIKRAAMAARFYLEPSKQLFVMGVTGTNGKTTTTYLLKHLFDNLHQSCGLLGTVEYVVGQQHYPSQLTTPDSVACQHLLRQMVQQGCRAVTMEVSSHALEQARVASLDFDVALFTNLTLDHLDYHMTMEAYADAKARLFEMLHPDGVAIINGDSPYADHMVRNCKAEVIRFGIDSKADVRACNLLLTPQGMRFDVHAAGKIERFYSPLVGRYNLMNILGAIAVGVYLQIPLKELAAIFAHTPHVPGRLEKVGDTPSVFIDYAHTDDALSNVLATLRAVTEGKIIVVFGCGGDRDRSKRPKMGAVAEQMADYVIVTNDNPRNESPHEIIDQICMGFTHKANHCVIPDRREAIWHALKMARPQDTVLVAGKGHERGQMVGRSVFAFDDRVVVKEFYEHSMASALLSSATDRL